MSHRMQRLQNERGVVMTLFWVQTAEGVHRLAASVRQRSKHPCRSPIRLFSHKAFRVRIRLRNPPPARSDSMLEGGDSRHAIDARCGVTTFLLRVASTHVPPALCSLGCSMSVQPESYRSKVLLVFTS